MRPVCHGLPVIHSTAFLSFTHISWFLCSSPAKDKSPAGKKAKAGRKVDTPMSCAETPTGGKDGDASIAAEVEAVALALEKEEEEEAAVAETEEKEDDDEGDADWVEEERMLREENKKREEENRRKNNKMGMKEKVALLDNLLQKAAAYTAFLRDRMKDTSEKDEPGGGATKKSPKKRDGQFEHQERDPRQPKLVEGVMRKYQIEGLMWICSLYENGLNGILAGAWVRVRGKGGQGGVCACSLLVPAVGSLADRCRAPCAACA